jgi:hypothetical protein
MNFSNKHFINIISEVSEKPLHKKIKCELPDNIIDLPNLIIYGPSGIGKYSQMLYLIQKYSSSLLKYQNKIIIEFNKENYYFKISDIHYEIDMNILGCNSKSLWNTIFTNIIDIINTKEKKTGIIVCKNFHNINNELLSIFYSYLKTKNVNLKFILLTEHISFINKNILNHFSIINMSRPSLYMYNKYYPNVTKENINSINSITNLIHNNFSLMNTDIKLTNELISYIDNLTNYNSLDFLELREKIYNLFTYNINIETSIYHILEHYINEKKITNENINKVLIKTCLFFQYFNNNYRPIFHLENYILYIIKVIHGF